MGHYRSEMGFEDEEHRRKLEAIARNEKIKANVRKQIDGDGVESVIADLVSELINSRVYVGYKWYRE